jgi:hypothetical protein
MVSFEEFALKAQETRPAPSAAKPAAPATNMPMGKIGNVQMSRLICGGNLISGFAHSRDLIYVSPLLKQYFTEAKIFETWALSEQHGINTMVINPADQRAAALYKKYREQGGRIQYLAQIVPTKDDLVTPVRVAKETGAVGALLQGNSADSWVRDGEVKLVGEFLKIIKDHGLIAGVAGHALKTMKAVEEAGYAPDFYMKTFHDTTYWSTRRPDQTREVIDNRADNYWCMEPKETAAWMSEVRRPWIAYKVLAAGAYHPRAGFRYAFDNGADFVLVGMFDFQIAEDVAITAEIVQGCRNRDREWFA